MSDPVRLRAAPRAKWMHNRRAWLENVGARVVTRLQRAGTRARAGWLQLHARRALSRQSGPLKLCLGSGAAPIAGWLNVDLDARADVVLDLRFRIPLPDASVDLVYSEHVIEHFSLEDGLAVMRECRRLLRPGGVMRVATPDLDEVVRDYQHGWRRHAWVQWPEYQHIDSGVRMVNASFRSWGHQYLYNFDELQLRLRECGFQEVVRAAAGESAHPELRHLETRADSLLVVDATA